MLEGGAVSGDVASREDDGAALVGINRHSPTLAPRLNEAEVSLYGIDSKPALLYGCETWIMRTKDKNKIESTEMRFLRRLKGVTLRDRERSNDIRKELILERSMVEVVAEYQKNWHEHVSRMPSDRLPKQAFLYIPRGRRDVGRPRTR